MPNWNPPHYDIVAAGRELGLSPKREATPWFGNKALPKDSPHESAAPIAVLPRRERLQETLEREARESREPEVEVIADKLVEAASQSIGAWIAHDIYSGMPVDGNAMIQVILQGYPPCESSARHPARVWAWGSEDIPTNIIAYRVVEQAA